MKKNITILLMILFLGFKGVAQKDTTLPLWIDANDSGRIRFESQSKTLSTSGLGWTIIKPDTVKCLMLVCDTSRFVNPQYIENQNDGGRTVFEIWYNKSVYWLFGYSYNKWNEKTYYFDDKKKPLKKSIVVWISIGR